MRFLTFYKPAEFANTDPAGNAEMEKLIEEETKAGALLAGGGYLPGAREVRVKYANGKVTVTDGPFTEAKELVGGFALLQAKSKEEAIELARRFLKIAGEGECEIRPLRD